MEQRLHESGPPRETAQTLPLVGPHLASHASAVDRPTLRRLAARFCWNVSDAEDAVQRALLIATQRVDGRPPADAAAWLKSIVVRQAIELNRSHERQRRLTVRVAERTPPEPAAGRARPPDAAMRQQELADAMRACVARLPEGQQIAVVLRHMNDCGYDEIAKIMGIAESTARVLVHGGREALRTMLAGERPELIESEKGR